ncbi:ATP synthase F1 subunit gamma [Streptobacillus felis]|uniref:ATP synthase gamma chain n=1 Tax=Streptobacillus felis TaxID=1384509 RepID=A0A7Z0PF11_9FUSO|nr:ATP synthase F1 subunit gamma [Streptobacillus felis]NYV27972.1 ATP synthase F1 subunit gamma [Streptobacillus felis]
MASNMKEIKARISSINNSKQITSAMNIVSSTKFKKFQVLTFKTREYEKSLEYALYNLLNHMGNRHNILFEGKKEVKNVGIVVMTSDRGLCGSFNSNTLKKTDKMIKRFKKEGKNVSIISIGRKARDYCKTRNIDVDAEYIQLIPETMFSKAKILSEDIVDFYLSDQYDEVYLIYSKFVSVINYNLVEERILPFSRPTGLKISKESEEVKDKRYIFEPDENQVLVEFLPKLLNNKLYQALLENSASEHSARMSAMKNASESATEIINRLTLEYNRIRQSLITQELSEIVGGSEAIK